MMRPFKMLVVDDDPAMVRLLQRVIERTFASEVCLQSLTDPRCAAEWIDNNLPDIVLTDLEMPQIDGLGILMRTKRRNAYAQVIVLTGHSSTSNLLEALENGACDYLLKPADSEELVAVLKQTIERLMRWKRALRGTWQPTMAQA